MPMNKPHREFHRLDMKSGWETMRGYPVTIQQKILSSDLDERGKMGSRTRLLRFEPGAFTTAPFVHDHWKRSTCWKGIWWWAPMRRARAARRS